MNPRYLCLSLLAALPLTAAVAQQPAAPPAASQTAAPVDLARKKPFVSSDPNVSNWNQGLTDGVWRGGRNVFATGNSPNFPKQVTIDLESPQSIGYVAMGVPGFGSTKTVNVSVSADGTTFTDVGSYVFTLKKEEKKLFSFPATTARYVRLTYVDHYNEEAGFSPTYAFTTDVGVYAPGPAPVLMPPPPPEKSDVPTVKYGVEDKPDAGFIAQHESFLKRGKEGKIGVLFLGDSITAGWRGGGKEIWNEHFAKYDPANFGIGGDRTQHVLWRIENGELDGINPKVVVLMIGTNNSGNSAAEITTGVKAVVSRIHQKLPDTKLLLLAIFPRAAEPNNPIRAKLKEVNAELAKLDDGGKTRYLDIGDKFLDPQGNLPKEIMPDYLHPNAAGYKIWAEAIQPLLDEMMK